MKTNLLTIMAAILIGLNFSSCSKIKGEGPTISENRNTEQFSAIQSEISGDIHILKDSNFSIEIRGQKNILDALNTTVYDHKLKIYFDHNTIIGKHDKIDIFISCPNVEGIDLSGSGSISSSAKFRPLNMQLEISGSGSINLLNIEASSINAAVSGSGSIAVTNGLANNVQTKISGSGRIDLMGVEAKSAITQTIGSGDTRLNVRETLNITISGSGDVYYIGRPRLIQSISGSGKVIAL